MARVASRQVPEESLLADCRRDGAYADCFVAEIDRAVTLTQFVEAFYTSRVFRLERLILKWWLSRPSTDDDARALAAGAADTFAAWRVESRRADEILLADFTGRTRSWLKTLPVAGPHTCLYFGSAVIPMRDAATGQPTLGRTYGLLLGFHKLYSRVLLAAARAKLYRPGRSQ